MTKGETFGQTLRRLREDAEISLRAFAKMVDRTPTYISKIERGELAPPAEEVIEKMARILKQNLDDMITLAGRIPSDLPDIIRKNPKEMAFMLRTAKKLTPAQLEEITNSIAGMINKKKV
jgi:transcriptional regulator with XRE-family HTH domain